MNGDDRSSSSEASGNTVNNYGLTIGQGLAIGALSAFAVGLGIAAITLMVMRDNSHERAAQQAESRLMEQLRKTETESRMVEYYLQDPSFRTKAELEEWARYKTLVDNQSSKGNSK